LGLFSSKTGLPDGMGMNVAGGNLHVRRESAARGISAQEYVLERRSAAGELGGALGGVASAAANNTAAENLGIVSNKKGKVDGTGMAMAGGRQAVQQEAAAKGISASAYVLEQRSINGKAGADLNATLFRGQRTPTMGITSRNAALRDLGEEVGAFVMGPDEWKAYCKKSTVDMPSLDRPFSANKTTQMAKERPAGARDGWKFDHVDRSEPRWSMTDKITYRRPNHTKEVPEFEYETLQAAISDAYHHSYTLHSRLLRRNQKDAEAGKKLSRSSHKPKKR